MDSLEMLSENMRTHMFKPFKFWADYSDDELSIWTFYDCEEPTHVCTRTRLQIFTPEMRKNLSNMTKHPKEVVPPIEITTTSPIDLQKRRLSLESIKSPGNSPSPRRTKIMSLGNVKPLISPTTPRRRRKS